MKKLCTGLLLSALISTNAFAEVNHDNSGDWYILPTISHIKSDQSRGSDDEGVGFGLNIGKRLTDQFNLELGYNRNVYDVVNTTASARQNVINLDALYFLTNNEKFSPFVSAGIGAAGNFGSLNDKNPTWGAGLGFLTSLGLTNQAKLRFEAKFQQEVDQSDFAHDDVFVGAGLQIPFGEAEKPMPKMEPKDSDGDGVVDADDKCPGTLAGVKVNALGCELDSDNDGVVDSKDQCPNTPAGTSVNANGCKIVEIVEAPKDTDGDGVYDDADRCPNTPAGTAVNSYGCAIDPDDDNDGVPNSKDQCPNTASGVRVDFKGCEIKAVITLPGINFETNSSTITGASLSVLDGAASTLNQYTDINAEVAGHTDSTGAAAYNKNLSERRAASVRDYLISKGVAASRLTSRGYGEEQPIADNSNKAGRAQNRRVELKVNQ